jgi:hypothetical protein
MDAQELADLRAEFLSELTETCSVLDVGGTEDDYGGSGGPPGPTLVYPCRVQEQLYTSPQEQAGGGRVESAMTFIIKMPWNAVVTEKNRIQSGDNIFEVIGNDAGRTDLLTLSNFCRRVK